MEGPLTVQNHRAGGDARILIIDDNPSIHRDFELVLLENAEDEADHDADERQMYGEAAAPAVLKPSYTVDHALSGIDGIEKVKLALAEERPYQLAFVDVRMPGIDGIETITRLWKQDSRIQVVICTAFSDYSWEELVRRWGQRDNLLILKKPFDNIEVTLLASTLTEKWFLARQAALKQEQMELLVARRTRKLLEFQPHPLPTAPLPPVAPDGPLVSEELPVVLVVESDAKASSQICETLGEAYRVIEARDGEEGLRLAQETVPDLVITEFSSPRLDGPGLCRCLKRTEISSHIPVIVIAAEDRADSRILALEAGAAHCLADPLSLPLLKVRADELLLAAGKAHDHLGPQRALQPSRLTANQADAQFLGRIIETVDRHLSDFEFDVEALAKKVAVSRRQLFRKLKAVTGGTPNALIRSMRLKRAEQLLKESQMTVADITYAVGFSDLKHFRSLFQEQFGVLPGECARKVPKEEPGQNESGKA